MAEQKNQNEHLNVEDALTQSEDVYKRQGCYLYRENLETKLHHCGWWT